LEAVVVLVERTIFIFNYPENYFWETHVSSCGKMPFSIANREALFAKFLGSRLAQGGDHVKHEEMGRLRLTDRELQISRTMVSDSAQHRLLAD
jgi:S-adenosylmethionine/arginine decarboxylase-like enzyme